MDSDKRTCFALIAATSVNKRSYNAIYDFQKGRHINIGSTGINSNYMSFFDYSRGGYVSGNKNNMYDYLTSSYVSLNIHNNVVSCYDYESSSFIDFTVNGNGVTAYDYQSSQFYQYSVI